MSDIGVYGITCRATGRIYIGSSTAIRSRISWHKSALRKAKHSRAQMQKDFLQYGETEFTFEIISECGTEPEALREEARLIGDAFKAGRCYNSIVPIDSGGDWSRKPRGIRKKKESSIADPLAWSLCEQMLEWRTEKEFIALIEQFLLASGISVSAFGWIICHNHRFLPEMRKGRGCTLRRAEQVDRFIEEKIAEFKASRQQMEAAA